MPTAWIYARKSKYRRRKKDPEHLGSSVTAQLEWARGQAAEHGWPVGDQYVDDSQSASRYRTDDREDFERLVADIERGRVRRGDVVICRESSRLQRDLAVYVRLRDTCWAGGVLWCWGGRVYDLSRREDRLMTGLDALLGEDQVAQNREGVLITMQTTAMKGRPHSNGTYGYKRLYHPETGELQTVAAVEEEAAIVREIVRRVAAGQTLTEIARDLTGRGIPSQSGGRWHRSGVRRVATNRAYIGERKHEPKGGDTVSYYPAIWEPIIASDADRTAWNRAQVILTDPKRKSYKDGAVKHLNSGIAICDVCECTVKTLKNGGYHLYACAAPGDDGTKGFHVGRATWKVDEVVEKVLFYRLSQPDARQWAGSEDVALAELEQLHGELAEKNRHLNEHYEQAAQQKLSARGLAAVEARMLPDIQALERRIENMRVPPSVARLIRETPEEVEEAWRELSIPEQRDIVRGLLEVRILRVGKGQRAVAPQDSVIVRRRARPSAEQAEVNADELTDPEAQVDP
ncbi:recombinase family protein [Nonomuraea sp. NPDC050404]|uniref:recombinase family protein n=1 Tax=Nonomuraea sp. NPDC050404 TaxID=3155783 RepID=UPI00340A88B6